MEEKPLSQREKQIFHELIAAKYHEHNYWMDRIKGMLKDKEEMLLTRTAPKKIREIINLMLQLEILEEEKYREK